MSDKLEVLKLAVLADKAISCHFFYVYAYYKMMEKNPTLKAEFDALLAQVGGNMDKFISEQVPNEFASFVEINYPEINVEVMAAYFDKANDPQTLN